MLVRWLLLQHAAARCQCQLEPSFAQRCAGRPAGALPLQLRPRCRRGTLPLHRALLHAPWCGCSWRWKVGSLRLGEGLYWLRRGSGCAKKAASLGCYKTAAKRVCRSPTPTPTPAVRPPACLRRDQPGAAALERAAALRLMSWLGQLAQAPALRDMLCDALLQPSTPSVAAQAGSLAATAGLPADLAAVARMLQQQREALLERLAAVLPVPGEAEAEGLGAAIARQQRPLPLPGRGPHQLSLLYWQLSAMLPLEGHLVEVGWGGGGALGVPRGGRRRAGGHVLACSHRFEFIPRIAATTSALPHPPIDDPRSPHTPTPPCHLAPGAGHAPHPAALQRALQDPLWPRAALLLPPPRRWVSAHLPTALAPLLLHRSGVHLRTCALAGPRQRRDVPAARWAVHCLCSATERCTARQLLPSRVRLPPLQPWASGMP